MKKLFSQTVFYYTLYVIVFVGFISCNRHNEQLKRNSSLFQNRLEVDFNSVDTIVMKASLCANDTELTSLNNTIITLGYYASVVDTATSDTNKCIQILGKKLESKLKNYQSIIMPAFRIKFVNIIKRKLNGIKCELKGRNIECLVKHDDSLVIHNFFNKNYGMFCALRFVKVVIHCIDDQKEYKSEYFELPDTALKTDVKIPL